VINCRVLVRTSFTQPYGFLMISERVGRSIL
jgi:hypothetical protein